MWRSSSASLSISKPQRKGDGVGAGTGHSVGSRAFQRCRLRLGPHFWIILFKAAVDLSSEKERPPHPEKPSFRRLPPSGSWRPGSRPSQRLFDRDGLRPPG